MAMNLLNPIQYLRGTKATIAQLEARQFNTALASNTAQQNRNDMNAMLTTILTHIAAKSSSTGTSQPA